MVIPQGIVVVGQVLGHLHGDDHILGTLQDQHRSGVAVHIQGRTAHHSVRIQIDCRVLQHNCTNILAVGHGSGCHRRTAHRTAQQIQMVGVYKVPALCRVNDGIQILHLLQDLFLIRVVNASGNIMEPMHALRTGAAICPAVKVKGVAGNTALGKTFQGRQVSLIVALCSVGI